MEKNLTCKERVRSHYQSRIADLAKLWKLYQAGEDESDDDLGTFNEYGLCFDYVPKGTFTDQRRGFWRYQLSTGGPGDEFRFYADERLDLTKIEYWFLDWFDGAKVNVTGKALALMTEIWEFFKECGTIEKTMKDAIES